MTRRPPSRSGPPPAVTVVVVKDIEPAVYDRFCQFMAERSVRGYAALERGETEENLCVYRAYIIPNSDAVSAPFF